MGNRPFPFDVDFETDRKALDEIDAEIAGSGLVFWRCLAAAAVVAVVAIVLTLSH